MVVIGRQAGFDAVAQAVRQGCEFKVAIRGLCDDLEQPGEAPLNHEVFIQLGSCYYYTAERVLVGGSHPVARVRPAVPLRYASGIRMPKSRPIASAAL